MRIFETDLPLISIVTFVIVGYYTFNLAMVHLKPRIKRTLDSMGFPMDLVEYDTKLRQRRGRQFSVLADSIYSGKQYRKNKLSRV